MSDAPDKNTDRTIWRESDEFDAPSIHITESCGIGINVGGCVFVMPVRQWHALAITRTRDTTTASEQPRCGRSGDLPGCV